MMQQMGVGPQGYVDPSQKGPDQICLFMFFFVCVCVWWVHIVFDFIFFLLAFHCLFLLFLWCS